MYKRFFKRWLDFLLVLCALLLIWPVLVVLTVIGAIMMKGNPFFLQPRPGRDEKIFNLIKFRTMSNCVDEEGEPLPDHERLSGYGKFLRKTSLDELPELLNILKGDMSLVGPRPQLVRDMVFMTPGERRRHSVLPGLTGLAQVNGRNNIPWEKKFEYDLQYIEKITFLGDLRIFMKTFGKVLRQEDINQHGDEIPADLGDYLLACGKVTEEEYRQKQAQAKKLLEEWKSCGR